MRTRIALLDLSSGPADVQAQDVQAYEAALGPTGGLFRCRSIVDVLEDVDNGTAGAVLICVDGEGAHLGQALALISECAPATVVIVIADSDDPEFARGCLSAGADDVLNRSEMCSPFARRVVERAIERRRFWQRSTEARAAEPIDWRNAAPLLGGQALAVSERSLGTMALAERAPAEYERAVRDYDALLELALRQQAFRREQPLSEDINVLADKLGLLGAGPRDIVDLHKTVMRRKLEAGGGAKANAKAKAYVDEGRLLMLQIMGYLVSFYRALSWGIPGIGMSKIAAAGAAARNPLEEDKND